MQSSRRESHVAGSERAHVRGCITGYPYANDSEGKANDYGRKGSGAAISDSLGGGRGLGYEGSTCGVGGTSCDRACTPD
jgi:hypothetical protein